jgi:hypothetical protein
LVIIAGWWFFPTPLKNMKVGWDDDIANIWKVLESHKKIFQTTNQIGFDSHTGMFIWPSGWRL